MPPLASQITLNYSVVQTQTAVLQRECERLKEVETSFKKEMDAMSASWQGISGKSFAEAAGRVEAGYVANRTAMEFLIRDVTESTTSLANLDEASTVSFISSD